MKLLGLLFGACIALAALQAAAVVFALALAGAAMVSLIFRPRETLGIALLLTVTNLAYDRPGTLAAMAAIVLVACMIGKAIERRRRP